MTNIKCNYKKPCQHSEGGFCEAEIITIMDDGYCEYILEEKKQQ